MNAFLKVGWMCCMITSHYRWLCFDLLSTQNIEAHEWCKKCLEVWRFYSSSWNGWCCILFLQTIALWAHMIFNISRLCRTTNELNVQQATCGSFRLGFIHGHLINYSYKLEYFYKCSIVKWVSLKIYYLIHLRLWLYHLRLLNMLIKNLD